jgi:hypothetical protein
MIDQLIMKAALKNQIEPYEPPYRDGGYHEARRKAAAFLLTTGAKAIVLTHLPCIKHAVKNQPSSSCSHIDTHKIRQGMTEEYSAKLVLNKESNRRFLAMNLASRKGLEVFKFCRNGKMRSMHIRVKRKDSGDILCWRSKYGLYKIFHLRDVSMEVHDSTSRPTSMASTLSSPIMKDSFETVNSKSKIRLKNSSRGLDLLFRSEETAQAFKDWLSLSYIDPRDRGITMPAHEENYSVD